MAGRDWFNRLEQIGNSLVHQIPRNDIRLVLLLSRVIDGQAQTPDCAAAHHGVNPFFVSLSIDGDLPAGMPEYLWGCLRVMGKPDDDNASGALGQHVPGWLGLTPIGVEYRIGPYAPMPGDPALKGMKQMGFPIGALASAEPQPIKVTCHEQPEATAPLLAFSPAGAEVFEDLPAPESLEWCSFVAWVTAACPTAQADGDAQELSQSVNVAMEALSRLIRLGDLPQGVSAALGAFSQWSWPLLLIYLVWQRYVESRTRLAVLLRQA